MSGARTVIVGASGLVGQAVSRAYAEAGLDGSQVALVVRRPRRSALPFPEHVVDLGAPQTRQPDLAVFKSADVVVWAAGGSDHGLGDRDARANLRANVEPLLQLLEVFTGHLVLVSSQAVYFGLVGPGIDEEVDHVPGMAYGLSKLVAERHAMWALARGDLAGLWVHRLMYTFGPGEAPRRLVPRLVAAASTGDRVVVAGGGASYVNPVPTWFVADVVRRCAEDLIERRVSGAQVTNLSYPAPVQVRDVVERVRDHVGVQVDYRDDGERWPVAFQGATARLEGHMRRWSLTYPDPFAHLIAHVDRLQEGLTS